MRYLPLLAALLFTQPIFAQTDLPIIKATTKNVSIRDGDYLDKNSWNLNPRLRPDIFTADRTRATKWVIFYTDIDSIKVRVKPGSRFDFIVLLNGKDSCYTRIASAIPPKNQQQKMFAANDSIPFTLTAYNAIQVRTVINDTDTLNLHFDVGSFDFDLLTPIYKRVDKVHKLQMGQLTWTDPAIGPTSFTAHDVDGRFGWNLFEGRTVEIDYDKSLLIIHARLPKRAKSYARSKLEFIRSYVCVKAGFKTGNKGCSGDFLLDTGSDQAIILDSAWTRKQRFPQNLTLLKTSVIKDPRGVKYESRIVCSPPLIINKFDLTDVPAYLLGSNNPTRLELNFLGNDLLKRFNIFLDFRNDYLYLKPNKLIGVKYRAES